MPEPVGSEEFHFLEDQSETGDEFLRRRLSYLRDQFSYENLSGLSVDGLNEQVQFYNEVLEDMYRQFVNPNFVFADDLEAYEAISGEELNLYEPVKEEEMMQVQSVANEIRRNFDKAREDARDRKYERLSKVMNSIPVLGRAKQKV